MKLLDSAFVMHESLDKPDDSGVLCSRRLRQVGTPSAHLVLKDGSIGHDVDAGWLPDIVNRRPAETKSGETLLLRVFSAEGGDGGVDEPFLIGPTSSNLALLRVVDVHSRLSLTTND